MAVESLFFRNEILLSMHLEPVDRLGKHQGAGRRQIISEAEELQLNEFNRQLDGWLDKVLDASSNAQYIFYVLNHRLNFMWWLIDHLIESEDPREATDFKFRCREDEKFSEPKSKKESTIGPLVIGLYQAIEEYLHELLGVVDNSLEGKVFIYSRVDNGFFDDKDYVKNLDELAQSGILPAKVLRLLIDKLNLLGEVLKRLKSAFKKLSSPESWPVYSVQLQSGGFSFDSEEDYDLFSHQDIFLDFNGDTVVCRGKVTQMTESDDENNPFRISIQFDLLTSEQQQTMILFEQRKELKDAMLSVALD